MSDFADIDSFAREYQPQQAFKPGPEVLPVGLYDCQIIEARLVKGERTSIFRLGLKVLSGPCKDVEIERPTWFKAQRDVDSLGGDMVTLGIAGADQWGRRGKTWSQELIDACSGLIGRRLRIQRKDRPGDRGMFHDCNIVSPITGNPTPPPSLLAPPAGHAAQPAAAPQPQQSAFAGFGQRSMEDIPF